MRDSQHLSGSDFSVTAYSSGLITGTDNTSVYGVSRLQQQDNRGIRWKEFKNFQWIRHHRKIREKKKINSRSIFTHLTD